MTYKTYGIYSQFLIKPLDVRLNCHTKNRDAIVAADLLVTKRYLSTAASTVVFMTMFFKTLYEMEEDSFLKADDRLVSALLHATVSYGRVYATEKLVIPEHELCVEEIVQLFRTSLSSKDDIYLSMASLPRHDSKQVVKYAVRMETMEYFDDEDLMEYDDSDIDSQNRRITNE